MLNSQFLSQLLVAVLAFADIANACHFHNVPDDAFNHTQMIEDNERARRHPPQSTTISNKTVIRNVRVFDGYKLKPPCTVVIDGTVIGTDPKGADKIIDAQGKTLLPGLIDAHAHPANITHLQELSRYGVTTTFVMACYSSQACRSLQNHTGLVDLKLGSAAAAAPGSSHGNITIKADPAGDLLVNSTEQAAGWVERQIAWGPDFIKVVGETPGLSQDTLTALTTSAHRHHKRVICHASINQAWEQAITARLDHIHHAPLDFEVTDEQAQQVLKQRQISTPTLSILRAAANNIPTDNYTAAVESVRKLHKLGVPMTAGTDANLQPGIVALLPFGISLHQELELLVDAGLSDLEALQAATSKSAALWKLHDRGVIAPGKRADLLLVEGDPTKDIKATRNIQKVWLNGVEYTGPLGTF